MGPHLSTPAVGVRPLRTVGSSSADDPMSRLPRMALTYCGPPASLLRMDSPRGVGSDSQCVLTSPTLLSSANEKKHVLSLLPAGPARSRCRGHLGFPLHLHLFSPAASLHPPNSSRFQTLGSDVRFTDVGSGVPGLGSLSWVPSYQTADQSPLQTQVPPRKRETRG